MRVPSALSVGRAIGGDAEAVRQGIGARPNPAKVEPHLLPLWRFEVWNRKEKGRPRYVWIEGRFGTTYREHPRGRAVLTS